MVWRPEAKTSVNTVVYVSFSLLLQGVSFRVSEDSFRYLAPTSRPRRVV